MPRDYTIPYIRYEAPFLLGVWYIDRKHHSWSMNEGGRYFSIHYSPDLGLCASISLFGKWMGRLKRSWYFGDASHLYCK